MLLAEELLLLSRLPDGGELRSPGSAAPGLAVAGGLLVDLEQAGLVTIEGGRVTPNGAVTGEPALAAALDALRKRRSVDLALVQVAHIDAVRRSLVDRGAIGYRTRFLRPPLVPVLDVDAHRRSVERLRAAAEGGELDARSGALLALAHTCAVRRLIEVDVHRPGEPLRRAREAEAASAVLAAVCDAVRSASKDLD